MECQVITFPSISIPSPTKLLLLTFNVTWTLLYWGNSSDYAWSQLSDRVIDIYLIDIRVATFEVKLQENFWIRVSSNKTTSFGSIFGGAFAWFCLDQNYSFRIRAFKSVTWNWTKIQQKQLGNSIVAEFIEKWTPFYFEKWSAAKKQSPKFKHTNYQFEYVFVFYIFKTTTGNLTIILITFLTYFVICSPT